MFHHGTAKRCSELFRSNQRSDDAGWFVHIGTLLDKDTVIYFERSKIAYEFIVVGLIGWLVNCGVKSDQLHSLPTSIVALNKIKSEL
jgi:hypothetical protein